MTFRPRLANIMSSEKLCLKWNDFAENILSGFKELRNDKEFTDVTLACEDGQQIGAHRVVLTTSSPLFRNMLKSNRHQHPLIYMRGVKFEDLVAIIDFLYCGEANVYQENLDDFLAIAEELKLKGLTGENEKEQDPRGNIPPKSDFKEEVLSLSTPPTFHRKEQPATTEPRVPFKSKYETERRVSLQTSVNSESDQLDEQIKSMMDSTENVITRTNGLKNRAFICKVCGKEAQYMDVRRHIEANHITNISHSCDICGKKSRSRNGLRQHTDKEHKK